MDSIWQWRYTGTFYSLYAVRLLYTLFVFQFFLDIFFANVRSRPLRALHTSKNLHFHVIELSIVERNRKKKSHISFTQARFSFLFVSSLRSSENSHSIWSHSHRKQPLTIHNYMHSRWTSPLVHIRNETKNSVDSEQSAKSERNTQFYEGQRRHTQKKRGNIIIARN